ncbi:MAG: hypothetical protein RMX65_008445 [Nostoc sp. DedQUE01]
MQRLGAHSGGVGRMYRVRIGYLKEALRARIGIKSPEAVESGCL